MAGLAGADYQEILDLLLLGNGIERDPLRQFPMAVMEGLRRLIPCDVVSYGDFADGGRGWRKDIFWAGEARAPLTDSVREAHAAYRHEDPIPPTMANGGAMTYSSRVPPDMMRRLGFYWEVMKPLGVNFLLRLWLVEKGRVIGGFDFDKYGCDFSHRECLMLNTLAPHLVAIRTRHVLPVSPASPTSNLTNRETEVLRLVSEGLTNGIIASRLYISAGTVRKHLDNIYLKLGVNSRAAAVHAVYGSYLR